MKIKRALISVWDKTGICELGQFLINNGIEILSTGGTQKELEKVGVPVMPIQDITACGAMMDGRVKTLHPKIFGGILADRKNESHLKDLNTLGGLEIDLVIVNFYPFVQEAVEKKLEFRKAIEFIDIGGPSMIRAAAKNYHSVLPLSNPLNYPEFMQNFIDNDGVIPLDFREKSAAAVFAMTSKYDSTIYNYFSGPKELLLENIYLNLEKASSLRYGENPHQQAAFYLPSGAKLPWTQHRGKALSYNNYADMESAFAIPQEFDGPACAIIKHANPCGFGLGDNLKEAYLRAVSTDQVSYFGGIVGFNREVDGETANELSVPFLECIIAPSFSNKAFEILKKKKNLRLVTTDKNYKQSTISLKSAAGGYLIQEKDADQNELAGAEVVSQRQPSLKEEESMKIGWALVRNVKSNAIVFANHEQLLAVGAGQMSRVDSVKIAIRKVSESGLNLQGAIMASDAFFPFPDSVEIAAQAGISAVIQPGGSIKDKEVIVKADELNLAMILTGIRHFLH